MNSLPGYVRPLRIAAEPNFLDDPAVYPTSVAQLFLQSGEMGGIDMDRIGIRRTT